MVRVLGTHELYTLVSRVRSSGELQQVDAETVKLTGKVDHLPFEVGRVDVERYAMDFAVVAPIW